MYEGFPPDSQKGGKEQVRERVIPGLVEERDLGRR